MNPRLLPILFRKKRTIHWAIYNDLTTGVLDPRITFSRASMATMVDDAGRLVYAPHNLALWSEDISDAAWVKTGAAAAVVTANAGLAPDGSNTADLIDLTPSSDARVAQTYSSPAPSGFAITMSVWLRAEPGQSGLMGMQVRRADASTPNTLLSVTDQWQRFTWTVGAATGTTPALWWIAHRGLVGHTLNRVLVWGAQIEYASTAGEYRKTTALAYHGPRFDFDPVTLQPLGLQIEAEVRTNLVTHSTDFTAASWAAAGASGTTTVATVSEVLNPNDGTTQSLFSAVSAAYARIAHGTAAPLGTGNNTTATSIFVRHKSGDAVCRLFLRNGAAGTVVAELTFNAQTGAVVSNTAGTFEIFPLPNNWWRVAVVGTPTGGSSLWFSGGPYLGAPWTGAVYLWQAQHEVGGNASSPIFTNGAVVTRSADIANVAGSNFPAVLQSASAYTLYAESRLERSTTAVTYPMPLRIGTTDNLSRVSLYFTGVSTNLVGEVVNSVGGFQGGVGAAAAPGLFHRIAFRAQTNDLRAAVNGALSGPDTAAAVPAGVLVRADIGVANFMGHIKAFGIAPVGARDAELLALTTP